MTIEEMILQEMADQGVTFKKLASRINCDRTHLMRCLKVTGGEKRRLSPVLKAKIEEVLNKEFSQEN